ncbi:dihydrolipoyl dehydrogenase [Candidatus Margulisiibacteriota bacterium]
MIYDTIIIGGGPAGYRAAEYLSEYKKSVCLIEQEKDHLGGTCLHEGCIPMKSMLISAETFHKIKSAEKYGINVKNPEINLKKIIEIAQSKSIQLQNGIAAKMKKNKITIKWGRGKLISENEVEITSDNKEIIQGKNIIIATGSKIKELKVEDPAKPWRSREQLGKLIFNSKQLLTEPTLSKNILIIGGGYIGCEFASLYSMLGSDVSIVEIEDQLLPGEDPDIARTLSREFKKQKMKIMTKTKVVKISKNDVIHEDDKGKQTTQGYERILVATGRIPNIDDLGLDTINITQKDGFITVDKSMKTNIHHIYAVGDVIHSPMLAHTAYREALIAAQDIIGKKELTINYNNIPRIIFTNPQIGCCGTAIVETLHVKSDEAHSERSRTTSQMYFKQNGKAIVENNDAGFVKIIYEKDTRKIVGTSIIGPHATELIHECALAIENNLTIDQIKNTIHGHPTLSELIADTLFLH